MRNRVVPRLLMSWFLVSPGHQQLGLRSLVFQGILCQQQTLYTMSWNDKGCSYGFVFPQNVLHTYVKMCMFMFTVPLHLAKCDERSITLVFRPDVRRLENHSSLLHLHLQLYYIAQSTVTIYHMNGTCCCVVSIINLGKKFIANIITSI